MSFLKALPAVALLFLPSSAATVKSVSVIPSSGKTDVVIGVNAAVEVQNFTLAAPARVVIDLNGATLSMGHHSYDRVERGGITNIRYSQFRPNVVKQVMHRHDVRLHVAVPSHVRLDHLHHVVQQQTEGELQQHGFGL